MATSDYRKHPRIRANFKVRIGKEAHHFILEGISVNMSQNGSLIKTEGWSEFNVPDRVVLIFLLPQEFTGQDRTIGLQGAGVVKRIDQENESIAVEFVREVRRFEPVPVSR